MHPIRWFPMSGEVRQYAAGKRRRNVRSATTAPVPPRRRPAAPRAKTRPLPLLRPASPTQGTSSLTAPGGTGLAPAFDCSGRPRAPAGSRAATLAPWLHPTAVIQRGRPRWMHRVVFGRGRTASPRPSGRLAGRLGPRIRTVPGGLIRQDIGFWSQGLKVRILPGEQGKRRPKDRLDRRLSHHGGCGPAFDRQVEIRAAPHFDPQTTVVVFAAVLPNRLWVMELETGPAKLVSRDAGHL
jgi:hypothetical protein